MYTAALSSFAGCKAVRHGIGGTERADIETFAQKTVEVLGLQHIQLLDSELVYLRAHANDPSFVELDAMQEKMAQVDEFRDHVISYSVNLIRVTEFNDTDADRIQAYAETLERDLREEVIATLGLTESEWTEVLDGVRAERKFLDALRAAQPIIDRASDYFEDLLSGIENEALPAVLAGFDRRIQEDFKETIAFIDEYYRVRDDYMAALRLLHQYRRGDEAALDELRARKEAIYSTRIPDGALSEEQIQELDAELADWIIASGTMRDAFDRDIQDYEKTRSELDRKEREIVADLGLARLQFRTWTQSHEALANGVKDPGKWLDMSILAAKVVRQIL